MGVEDPPVSFMAPANGATPTNLPPNTVYVQLQPGQQPPPGSFVVYTAPQPTIQPIYIAAQAPQRPYYRHAVASLVLFVLGLTAGFGICLVPSVAISLHMVVMKVIPAQNRAKVIAFSVFELIASVFLFGFSWFFTSYTTSQPITNADDYYDDYDYSIPFGVCYNYGYDPVGSRTYYCSQYYGWIAIVVFFVVGLAFGTPRTIYTFQARNNLAGQQ
jgi:hypothetical protein